MRTAPLTVADLPGPRGLPLLGNLIGFARGGTPHRSLYRWRERYGPTYRIRLPGTTAVVTSDPGILRAVFRERPDGFRRGRFVSDLIDELGGHGLFSAEGDDWRRLRRIGTRGLGAASLHASFGTVAGAAGRLRDRWQAAAASGERVDVLDHLMRYTLEVVTGVTMGHELGGAGEGDLHRHLALVFATLRRRLNSPVPYWRLVRLPADRKVDAAVAQTGRLILDRYAEARSRMAGGGEPGDFLTALARADLDGEEPLSDADVVGSVLTMIVAGQESSAAATAWAVHFLATHPEVQQRVRAEAEAELDPDGPPDAAALPRLRLAGAVIDEAIRLRPPSPFVVMEPLAETTVGGLRVGPGTPIFVLQAYGSATDADRYPDPGAFRPGRPADAAQGEQPYLPFGSGPRFCPGRNLALLEATLLIATICRAFTLEPDTSAGPVGERETFALYPTNLGVRLRPASDAPGVPRDARGRPATPRR
ncbi:cytochrome P450 [Couchioplanes caeruleus]|uniref:cytochrome P450 n=1 Tax=Couchioplanes caeruleus TaxID=56438 RepID=UPI00201C0478|nr:cytochrome P450 [Couchioplanes caeruleus]UQU63217.1 cytochrome P450 [Couchioplanes caeruleus]